MILPSSDLTSDFTGLEVGNYAITVLGVGDGNHLDSNGTAYFTVSSKDPEMNVTFTSPIEGENATVTVNVAEDAKGNVTVTINGIDYNATVENGTATVTVPVLPAGDTNVTVTYTGDEYYSGKTVNVTIHVKKILVDASDMKRGWGSLS